MANHSGPTSEAGKAASSRNALKHGLTSLHPVVTDADRPEYEALRRHLFDSLQPTGYLQDLKFERIVTAAWNMQRCLKLETLVMSTTGGADPLGNPDAQKQAALFQRYYLRFEGSYRANLRELERIQRLEIRQDDPFGEQRPIGALHNIQDYQRVAKRNGAPPQPAPQTPQKPQPQSNQQGAKQNPVRREKVGRNEPCPCGSGRKYKRCCNSSASPSLHAA